MISVPLAMSSRPLAPVEVDADCALSCLAKCVRSPTSFLSDLITGGALRLSLKACSAAAILFSSFPMIGLQWLTVLMIVVSLADAVATIGPASTQDATTAISGTIRRGLQSTDNWSPYHRLQGSVPEP